VVKAGRTLTWPKRSVVTQVEPELVTTDLCNTLVRCSQSPSDCLYQLINAGFGIAVKHAGVFLVE
jgi:hypothetical protein